MQLFVLIFYDCQFSIHISEVSAVERIVCLPGAGLYFFAFRSRHFEGGHGRPAFSPGYFSFFGDYVVNIVGSNRVHVLQLTGVKYEGVVFLDFEVKVFQNFAFIFGGLFQLQLTSFICLL